MNTQDTTFSIERYQELVVEKGTHEVRLTEKGIAGRIICTDLKARSGPLVVAAFPDLNDNEICYRFDQSGKSSSTVTGPAHLCIMPNAASITWLV